MYNSSLTILNNGNISNFTSSSSRLNNNYPRLVDFKSFAKVLEEKLKKIAQDLIDPDASLNLNGIIISPTDKFGTGALFLLDVYMKENETTYKIITSIRDKMLSIEREVQKLLINQ